MPGVLSPSPQASDSPLPHPCPFFEELCQDLFRSTLERRRFTPNSKVNDISHLGHSSPVSPVFSVVSRPPASAGPRLPSRPRSYSALGPVVPAISVPLASALSGMFLLSRRLYYSPVSLSTACIPPASIPSPSLPSPL